jgi:adenylosuccinate synthase
MPVTVIVGGQFGSEGKGKVAFYWAQNNQATVAVRVGGSNSGHTVIDSSGNPQIFQHLPTAALLPHIYCVIPAGSYLRLCVR